MITLWCLHILGLVLFIFALRKPPRKDWLLMFLISAYFAIILGVIVVEEHLLTYPVSLFKHFQSSVLFEFLLFPVLCTYYYQTSYFTGAFGIIWQAVVFSGVLTIIEFCLERYTDLIRYLQWDWYYTFTSVFLFMVSVRFLMWLINYRVRSIAE
ncbi:CBO0543 family protein [Halobacillus amylolyticus]|uniref:CBO0543 family protein n=1 Tax=Halobacillus amylolyticus TaxID=2932259 RepID=UPI0027389952|nr:CBO0543 family protein [Halobacillus amylolyticus]